MAVNPTIAVLEMKYIELLEAKTARLENAPDSEKSKSTNLKKKDSRTLMRTSNEDGANDAARKVPTSDATANSRIHYRERRYNKEDGLMQEEDALEIPARPSEEET